MSDARPRPCARRRARRRLPLQEMGPLGGLVRVDAAHAQRCFFPSEHSAWIRPQYLQQPRGSCRAVGMGPACFTGTEVLRRGTPGLLCHPGWLLLPRLWYVNGPVSMHPQSVRESCVGSSQLLHGPIHRRRARPEPSSLLGDLRAEATALPVGHGPFSAGASGGAEAPTA